MTSFFRVDRPQMHSARLLTSVPHFTVHILQDDEGAFNALHPPQQQATVLPLMHAEDLKQHEVQHCSVVLPS